MIDDPTRFLIVTIVPESPGLDNKRHEMSSGTVPSNPSKKSLCSTIGPPIITNDGKGQVSPGDKLMMITYKCRAEISLLHTANETLF